MVISSWFQILFVICEVILNRHKHKCSRMLVQAIVLVCTRQSLLLPTSTRNFFVVAIYVDTNMVAFQYIIMKVGDDSTCNDRKPVSDHSYVEGVLLIRAYRCLFIRKTSTSEKKMTKWICCKRCIIWWHRLMCCQTSWPLSKNHSYVTSMMPQAE